VYQAFYFIINFGSFFSTLLIPFIWQRHGATLAFAIPGILMAIATFIFWLGRGAFVHVPPTPGGKLGLLDAASSAALFFSVGHLFFTSGMGPLVWLPISALLLALGFGLFSLRQRLAPDDGFLAIMVYAISRRLRGPTASFWRPAVERFGAAAVEGPVAVLRIMSVFFLVSIFWALFDQHGSSWILQARNMYLPTLFGMKLHAAQVPSVNPVLVMLLIPLMNTVVYPAFDRVGMTPTPLRRMTGGMIIAAAAFVAVALLQRRIDQEGLGVVHVGWQLVPYVLITIAEVLVSITGLEFAYSQAPPRMKSTIMGFWLLSVALGNVLVSLISGLTKLPLEQFFWVFAALMLIAGVLFGIRAYFYEPRDYVQQ
jgi:POT family proton-dependent oligopeptide transporter